MSKGELNTVELDDGRKIEIGASEKATPVPREERLELQNDGSFLGALNAKMKNADWSQYKRGSEAFFDVDRDLELLGRADPKLAEELWRENTPKGTKLPYYLEAQLEQSAAERAAGRGAGAAEADKEPGEPEKRAGEPEKGPGQEAREMLSKKYLAAQNRFYFRDQENKLAFEDRGRKLVTEHNDPDVAASLVHLAEAKGWEKIKVTGHDDFKREVWLQAMAKGLEVTGYKPKEADLVKLAELREARLRNGIEQDTSPSREKAREEKPREAVAEREASPGREAAAAERPAPGLMVGKLLEHGKADYEFDKKNDPSYFVKLQTADGVRLHWGVDLERAMFESGAEKGDTLRLQRLDKEMVVVREKLQDEQGRTVDGREIAVPRTKWQVEVDGKEKVREEPKLAGEYQVAVEAFMKVLKEKGYSDKTLQKALQVAKGDMAKAQEAGVPAPGVKVYDKSAGRERPREKVERRSRDKAKELER